MIFTFVALLESCYVTYISTMPPATLMECTEAKQKAEKVDSIARRTIPSIFFLLLCFAYNMESVEDAYAIDPCPSGVCPVTIGGKELGKEGLKYLPLIALSASEAGFVCRSRGALDFSPHLCCWRCGSAPTGSSPGIRQVMDRQEG